MNPKQAIKAIQKDMAHRPSYAMELDLIKKGYSRVAGMDEAGRGPLAGPVSAAAVIIPENKIELFEGRVRDSKKMTPKRRAELYPLIKEHCIYSINIVDSDVIDTMNILNATKAAMRACLEDLPVDYALIDGNMVFKNLKCPYKSVVKGDDLALSISCASVLAKVYRDALMCMYGAEYPEYNFHKHKGYGTKEHREAIKRHGITPIHRKSFGGVKEYV